MNGSKPGYVTKKLEDSRRVLDDCFQISMNDSERGEGTMVRGGKGKDGGPQFGSVTRS